MLYVVGLGLSDEKDITVKGLEVSLKAHDGYICVMCGPLDIDNEVFVARPQRTW